MFHYKEYHQAASLEEAYELAQKKNNVVLGGTAWLKMKNVSKGTAIDLCDLNLNEIEENETEFRIGAYVSLRMLEKHETLNTYTNGAVEEAMKHIVGVQFRNTANVGGSIWGRFGFSDVYSIFLALDARVVLYHAGEMSLEEFAANSRKERDILTHVIVPKKGLKAAYLTQRNTQTDFPVLTCAIARECDGRLRTVIGARPALAKLCIGGEEILKEEGAKAYAAYVSRRMNFGTNLRGSAQYRRHLCEVLIVRTLEKMEKEGACPGQFPLEEKEDNGGNRA